MTAIGTLPVVLGVGIHSARPAASAVGKGGLYSCTTHSLVYQTDGSSWSTWATLGSVAAAYCGAKAYNAGTQSINNNSETTVTFDTEEYDTDAIHSTSSNTGNFVVPTGKDGKWRITATVVFAGNANGQRTIYLKRTVTGPTTTYLRGGRAGQPGTSTNVTNAIEWAITVTTDQILAAGDIVFCSVYQNSGGALNIGSATDAWVQSTMWVQFLGA